MDETHKAEIRDTVTDLLKYTYILGILNHSEGEWFMDGILYSFEDMRALQQEKAKRLNELIERG